MCYCSLTEAIEPVSFLAISTEPSRLSASAGVSDRGPRASSSDVVFQYPDKSPAFASIRAMATFAPAATIVVQRRQAFALSSLRSRPQPLHPACRSKAAEALRRKRLFSARPVLCSAENESKNGNVVAGARYKCGIGNGKRSFGHLKSLGKNGRLFKAVRHGLPARPAAPQVFIPNRLAVRQSRQSIGKDTDSAAAVSCSRRGPIAVSG